MPNINLILGILFGYYILVFIKIRVIICICVPYFYLLTVQDLLCF